MSKMPKPTGIDFGKQLGSLIAGHNLMIPGKPQSFSPLLARHFLMVEAMIKPVCDALYASHSISCYFSYPGRTDLAAAASDEAQQHLKAQLWWSTQLNANKDGSSSGGSSTNTPSTFADPWAMGVRGVAVGWYLSTIFPCYVVASCFPGATHQFLATTSGILARKYEATSSGAPPGAYGFNYLGHSEYFYRMEKQHETAAQSAFFCPFACGVALFWLMSVLSKRYSGSAQQSFQQQQFMQPPPQQQPPQGQYGGAGSPMSPFTSGRIQ